MQLGDFKVDDVKGKEGVIKTFGTDGAYIRVARADNPAYQKLMRKGLEPYKAMRKSKIPPDEIKKVIVDAMAGAILLEMVGFTDTFGDVTGTQGGVIEDNLENRKKVLEHKSYEQFREMVATISNDFDQFRAEIDEGDEGNSERSSDGAGAGDAS